VRYSDVDIEDITHIVILGRTGVNKTVLLKSITEDMVNSGITSILIDPKGDLASMLIPKPIGEVYPQHWLSYKQYWSNTDFRLWTPKTSEGECISLNPFVPGYRRKNRTDFQLYVENVGHTLVSMTGVKVKDNETDIIVDEVMRYISEYPGEFRNVNGFLKYLKNTHDGSLIYKELSKVNIGNKRILLNEGKPLDMNLFLPDSSGKTPLNIISFIPLSTKEEQIFFITVLSTMIFRWGLTYQTEKKQLFFGIDECYNYLPSRRKPKSKIALHNLIDQGRGLGIICCFTSNKISDLDYNIIEQANLWIFGNMVTRPNIRKVQQIVSPIKKEIDKRTDKLMGLNKGEVLVFWERGKVYHITDIWQLFSIHKPVNRKELKRIHQKNQFKKIIKDRRIKTNYRYR